MTGTFSQILLVLGHIDIFKHYWIVVFFFVFFFCLSFGICVSRRTNSTPGARGGGREDQPHVQGAMAVQAQEGLEELSHIVGQEGRW